MMPRTVGAPLPKNPTRVRNVPHPADARSSTPLENVELLHRQARDGDDPRDVPVDPVLKEEDGLVAVDSSTALVNGNDPHTVADVESDVFAWVLVLDDDGDGV